MNQEQFIILILIIVALFIVIRQLLSKFFLKDSFQNLNQGLIKPVLNDVLMLAIPFVLYFFLQNLSLSNTEWVGFISHLMKGTVLLGLWLFYRFISKIIRLFNAYYNQLTLAKSRPIEPLLQAFKIFVLIVLGLFAISVIVGQDVVVLIGSVGAITALISLIFKDLILGFFASLLLTSSDIIQIGDWVEVPSLQSAGTVESVGLTTITLRNRNQSKTTLPSYKLMSSEITNYRFVGLGELRLFNKTMMLKFPPAAQLDRLPMFIDDLYAALASDPLVNKDQAPRIQFNDQQLAGQELSIQFYVNESDLIKAIHISTKVMAQLIQIQKHYHFM